MRNDLVEFLVARSREGKPVVGYGAPGKGNTLLNHCGIRSDLLAFTVDRNPYKHGKFLPGTHIPIHRVDEIAGRDAPDYVRDPAVEPARRDRARSSPTSASGAAGSSSAARGSRSLTGGDAMKVVLFCGGLGMRMRRATSRCPSR